jgi:hypothetical protein
MRQNPSRERPRGTLSPNQMGTSTELKTGIPINPLIAPPMNSCFHESTSRELTRDAASFGLYFRPPQNSLRRRLAQSLSVIITAQRRLWSRNRTRSHGTQIRGTMGIMAFGPTEKFFRAIYYGHLPAIRLISIPDLGQAEIVPIPTGTTQTFTL